MGQAEEEKVGLIRKTSEYMRLILSSLKRTILTAPYWINLVKTFKFFIAFKQNYLARHPFTWFRYHQTVFGVRPIDWYIMESILLEEEYQLIEKAFSNQNPKIIIDAGANIGLFSIYALAKWPQAEILSVEPGPETYEVLKLNQEKNSTLNWRIFQYALWDKEENVFFDSNGLSIGWHISTDQTEFRVPTIRLDNFINNNLPKGSRISLLKIDIEGAEESVLTASSKILEYVDTVLIEIHPNYCDEETVINTLRNEFQFLYKISSETSNFPILIANREPLSLTGILQE